MTSHMRPFMPNSENNLKSRLQSIQYQSFSNVEKTPKDFATPLKHMIYGFQNSNRKQDS